MLWTKIYITICFLLIGKGVYLVYKIKRPFLGDLENVPETINNSRLYILNMNETSTKPLGLQGSVNVHRGALLLVPQ